MASVLRLCQKLLEGPEEQSSEADHQSLQLLQVNLERRWEAIVMQVLQWQSHLKHTLGRDQVRLNVHDCYICFLSKQPPMCYNHVHDGHHVQ